LLKNKLSVPGFLAALLFTWGVSSSLLKLYSADVDFIVTAVLSLTALAVFALIFYNRNTLIAALGVSAVLLILYARNFAVVNEYLTVIFFRFAKVFLFEAEMPPDNKLFFALIFCCAAAIPAILFYGKLEGALILGVISGGLIFFESQISTVDFYPELCALTSAVIGVSAGTFAASLNPSRKVKSGVALRVMPAALAVSVLLTLFTPDSALRLHSIAVETFVDDYVDLLSVDAGFKRSRIAFDLASYGYDSTKLGGPVSLSGNAVYAVRSDSASLFRVSVKDVYTGTSWESRDEAQFRFDSPLADGIRAETFSEGLPRSSDVKLKASISRDTLMSVTILSPDWRSELLHSGRPYRFSPNNIVDFIPYFNTNGEVFSKRYLYQGLSYTVYENRLNDFTGAAFNAAAGALEAAARRSDVEAPDPVYEEMLRKYTSLPENLPREVTDFVAASSDIESPYYRVLDVRERLSNYTSYTLTPPEVPDGREFVSWFLESRLGYCTYYATAMTVFARIIGLPARYAEGFTTYGLTRSPDGSFIISGEQAHAWCEVYVQGIGWIPVDATLEYASQLTDEPAADEGFEIGAAPALPSMTPPPNEEYVPLVVDNASGDTDSGNAVISAALYIILGLLIVCAGLFLAIYALRFRFRLPKRINNAEALLLRYWRDILKMLPSVAIIPRTGETPSKLAGRSEQRVYFGAVELTEVTSIVEDCVYGSAAPDSDALTRVYNFHSNLDRELLKILLPHGYISARLRWRKN
jgi:transglutaminase-like putative cysteine protease